MNYEQLMEDSLQGDWPGDEELMNECAEILDATWSAEYPRLHSVMRPIQFFIETLEDGQLQRDFSYLYRFLMELASTADGIESNGSSV